MRSPFGFLVLCCSIAVLMTSREQAFAVLHDAYLAVALSAVNGSWMCN